MADSSKKIPQSFWIGSSLLFGLLGLTAMLSFLQTQRAEKNSLPVLGAIADFTLTNQNNHATTLAGLTNHVWVADIIFSRCAGPCPRMTQQMKSVQDSLPKDSTAKLVTLTTDPNFDTPPVLEKYGKRFDADFSRWTFLTGTKPEIAALASGSLKLSAVPVPSAEQKDAADLFIHTTIFVVVDKHAQLRGIFETGGEGVEWTNVQPRILETIRQLEREP
jgi:protein SCO1/2